MQIQIFLQFYGESLHCFAFGLIFCFIIEKKIMRINKINNYNCSFIER